MFNLSLVTKASDGFKQNNSTEPELEQCAKNYKYQFPITIRKNTKRIIDRSERIFMISDKEILSGGIPCDS